MSSLGGIMLAAGFMTLGWVIGETICLLARRWRNRRAGVEAVAEPWSVGAIIRWQDSEMRRLAEDLKGRG